MTQRCKVKRINGSELRVGMIIYSGSIPDGGIITRHKITEYLVISINNTGDSFNYKYLGNSSEIHSHSIFGTWQVLDISCINKIRQVRRLPK